MGANRGLAAIAVILVAMLLGGCVANKRVDNNSANISIIANRTNNLKADVIDLRTQVDKLIIQVAGLNEKLDALAGTRMPDKKAATDAASGSGKVDREVILLEQELSIVERRLENLEQSKRTPAPNIKVLAGTTDMQSAKDMAAFLTRNGFPVRAVDYATTGGYKYDTVYYAEGFESHAQQLAETLGGKTIIKPLTWKSVFDVIAVKGGPQ